MQSPKFVETYPKLFNIILNSSNKKEFYRNVCEYPGGASRIENLILNGEIDPYSNSYIHEIMINPNAFYIIKDYIMKNKNNYSHYIENPSAMDLINIDDIDIYSYAFFKNPHPKAIKIIEKKLDNNIEIINEILQNPGALLIIEKIVDKYFNNQEIWRLLSSNPLIVKILKKYNDPQIIRSLDWFHFSQIPEAIDIINENKNLIDWRGFSKNPAGINILIEKYQCCMSYIGKNTIPFYFASNPHPKALDYLNNLPNCNYLPIYWNKGLIAEYCKIDYNKMKQIMSPIFEEICQKVFHPERLERIANIYWNRYKLEMIDSTEIYNGDIYNTIDYYYKRTEKIKLFRNELIVNTILLHYPNILIY